MPTGYTCDLYNRKRYQAMLDQVNTWIPPTSEHDGLKKFMIEQLTSSIEGDCGMRLDKPKHQMPVQYKAGLIRDARLNIKYHTEEHRKEVQSDNERNYWLATLRKSLSGGREVDQCAK